MNHTQGERLPVKVCGSKRVRKRDQPRGELSRKAEVVSVWECCGGLEPKLFTIFVIRLERTPLIPEGTPVLNSALELGIQ